MSDSTLNSKIKIDFWRDLWIDLINNFSKTSFGLSLYNPHILIDDIISEIEDNSFKNNENKNFFYSKLSNYLDHDIVIQQNLKTQFKVLRKIFKTDRIGYILETSKGVKEIFQNGLYFDSSLDLLVELLVSEEEMSKETCNKINYYTQGIIVEFIKKGYSLNDIKTFIVNIFDNIFYLEENNISTNYPHGINYEEYKNDNAEFLEDKYNKALLDLMSNLQTKERIKRLSFYYYKKKEKAFYIFVIQGLKGNVDISIGGINFYSLSNKKYLNDPDLESVFEDLQGKELNEKFIQAAVPVDFLMPESSLVEAITKLDNALDIISCYFPLKTDFIINSKNYTIIDENGNLISGTFGAINERDPQLKHHFSLDLNTFAESINKLNNYSFLWSNNNHSNKVLPKIKNALHWCRKAESSVKQEDKMLNYWIAIENLFNLEEDIKLDVLSNSNKTKFHLIQEIVSSTQIFSFIYEYGWELYFYYASIVNNPFREDGVLPDHIIQKAQLNSEKSKEINLKNFVACLDEISQYEKNPFILNKIFAVKDFYGNASMTKQLIEKQIIEIKEDLLMIYRFRNLIIHNAQFDNALLPYYVWKLNEFSSILIRRIIEDYKPNLKLSDIMLRIYLKKEIFLNKFENGKVDLFKI